MKFRDMEGSEILEYILRTVVTTEERPLDEGEEEYTPSKEVEEYEETETVGKATSLRIYYLKTSIEPGGLKNSLKSRIGKSVKARHLFDRFDIEVLEKESPFWLLIFNERGEVPKEYYYLIRVIEEDFWEVYTDEKYKNVQRTFRRLVDVSDSFNFIWVSRKKLDSIVGSLFSPESISGFSARRDTLSSKERVTLVLYGGDGSKLDLAREHFSTEPTSIFFKKTNSPTVAIGGALTSENGLRIDKILPDSFDDFLEINNQIRSIFTEREYNPIIGKVKNFGLFDIRNKEGDVIGQTYEGFHSVLFEISEKFWDEKNIKGAIEKKFLEGRDGKDYIGYEWVDSGCYFVYDLIFGGLFKLRIIPDKHCIIVSPDKDVSSKSLSNFCTTFMGRIDHSATIRPVHEVFG